MISFITKQIIVNNCNFLSCARFLHFRTSIRNSKFSIFPRPEQQQIRTFHEKLSLRRPLSEKMETPDKSPNDKKSYRVIKLGNGLTALLISEPKENNEKIQDEDYDRMSVSDSDDGDVDEDCHTNSEDEGICEEAPEPKSCAMKEKLAAAAMCIGVGNFSDPEEICGLAHYLEHMVFMGSEKYPDENKFDAFVTRHGGSNNASTDSEKTVFQFAITQKYFHECLNIFAQFFISPLMKADSMDREMKAVESEFQMSFPTDYFRKEHLFRKLAKDGHPMSAFKWGNVYSLKTLPEQANIDIYKYLHEFRKKHYSAHFMKLVVQARETLDTLQEWVEEIFSHIPNNGLPSVTFDHFKDGFKTEQFHKFYKVVPVKNTHQVTLNWALPSLVKFYKAKPLHYLGWLVGHEGKGSILSYLRKRVWALTLCGGNDGGGFENNSTYSLFNITIMLTDEGLDHLYEVITVVLEYLEMLRQCGPNERIFKEIQTIEDNDFRFKEEDNPVDNVESLSEGMQDYEPRDYLTGYDLLFEYNPSLIKESQDALTPENVNIVVMSSRFEEESSSYEKEKWSQAPFSASEIDAEWMKKWKNLKPRTELHIPEVNKFIATDFGLRSADFPDTEYPVVVHEDEIGRLWYKKDKKFETPKAYVYFHMMSPVCPSSSVENEVLKDLFINILDQNLKDETYDASVAQLDFIVNFTDVGFILKCYGFNHKLPVLFDTIIDYLVNFKVADDLFDAVKSQLTKTYFNKFIKPINLCRDVGSSILQERFFGFVDKRVFISKVNKKMVVDFAQRLTSNVKVEGLIQGNVTGKDAIAMQKKLQTRLNCKPCQQIPDMRVVKMPEVSQLCKVVNFNPDDSNSVVTNYYQYGPTDIYNMCMMELVMTFMSEPLFDVIRTREQLSYSVRCLVKDTFGIMGFMIAVFPQADKYSCGHVQNRIESFLDEFAKIISDLSEEEFESQVKSLIKLKQCTDLYLKEEVDRNWNELTSCYYVYDRLVKEVECLTSVTLSSLRTWYGKNISKDGDVRKRKLTIQVVGVGCKEAHKRPGNKDDSVTHCIHHLHAGADDEVDRSVQQIDDIGKYKMAVELYPPSKITEHYFK